MTCIESRRNQKAHQTEGCIDESLLCIGHPPRQISIVEYSRFSHQRLSLTSTELPMPADHMQRIKTIRGVLI